MSLKYSDSLDSPNKYSCFFKIIILGDAAVGKSSLLLRFSEDKFEKHSTATFGIDFRFKTIILNGQTIKLQIWDTAGQEMYDSISSMYIKNGDGILLLYDVSSRTSFDNLAKWIEVLKEHSPKYEELAIFIVGHKSDLSLVREVRIEEAKKFAEDHKFPYIEVSSKLNSNVTEVFTYLVENIMYQMDFNIQDDPKKKAMRLDESSKVNYCGCCNSYS